MSANTPPTAAWNRLRDTVATIAADHRAAGHRVIEAYADHGTVKTRDDGALTFVFTVSGETATALSGQTSTSASAIRRTEIQYVDTGGHRLYLLEIHQPDDNVVTLVAGGVRQRSLKMYVDTSGPARTKIRSISDAVALELAHDDRTPFLVGVE